MDTKSSSTSVKKRRRGAIVQSGKPDSSSVDYWGYEEEEILKRDPEKDLKLFKQTCDEIKKIMKEIHELKHRKNVEPEVTERRIQASLLFVVLKKLNRLEKIRNKKARDATNESKQKVDTYHLQLQNLMYEVTHLQKEVNKCLEFKSKDEDIELVSVQEFYRDAPPEISKPESTKQDEHKQKLSRLDWELEQRKRLAEKCTQAEASKDIIIQEIKKKQEYLDNLGPRLNAILQATIPVQNFLGMPNETHRIQYKKARYLSSPLFILYVQANAYAEACDKKMTVSVEGDIEEAKALKDSTEERDVDSDSDQEDYGGEIKKRHRRNTTDQMSEMRKKTLEKHPLIVQVIINCKDGCYLKIKFYYMLVLHIITVKAEFVLGSNQENSIPSRNMLTSEVLLSCLFPGDDGLDTPNPANYHQLRRIGLDEFSTYVNELGNPYLWAQRLGGLEFIQLESGVPTLPGSEDIDNEMPSTSDQTIEINLKSSASVSVTHMERTIKEIRSRVNSRIDLQSQLCSLEQGIVPLSPASVPLFPVKVSSRLLSWKSIVWDDIKIIPSIKRFIDEDIIQESSFYFEATIEKGSAKMVAVVAVSPNYPHCPPVFILDLHWKSVQSSMSDDSLLEIERELNVYWTELVKDGQSRNEILANQVQRLLVCFDIYLECEAVDSAVEGPVEFSKEKVFFRKFRGPNRSKPYHFLPKLGLFVHR